jgi:hypothetical protein
MIRASGPPSPITLESEGSPQEREQALAERERYLRNLRWFSDHATEVGRAHVGKFVCVAEGELFVGSVPEEVLAEARRKHPEDYGALFWKYISPHRGPKVYANLRPVADV